MINLLKKYLLSLLCVGFLPLAAFGQLNNEYFVADQLLRQQKYEQAYKKFYRLHQQNPSTFTYLEKATECLVNMKEYDKAISLTLKAAQDNRYRPRAQIRLGEIYHISGDTQKAHSIWNNVQEKYADSQQIQLWLARTLSDRQIFDRAIEIYTKVRQHFSNSNAITSELAGIYLQAGKYEKAIQEYLQLVKNTPERLNFVQQRLIRFRDDYIYDVAILEISDFLEELSPNHPSYGNLQHLEVWLLMERNLYKRAMVTAKNYESQSSQLTYILYSIGPKLLAAQKFKLAKQAYSYYIDNNIYSVKYRSLEELANVYRQWAKYLENYNLGLSSKRKKLYQKAYKTLERVRDEKPDYRRIGKILIALSELSLDVLHQPERASEYLEELRGLSDSTLLPHTAYIQGRLHLYNRDYTRARISFTESKKMQGTGSLAEKARYYLALTDFYAGDYEFAKIQLNALERQNTSYFANDALQLRIWIQNGLQADSTGRELAPFARAVEYFAQGKDQLGSNKLQDMLRQESRHPLMDDAILELSTHKTPGNVLFVYRTISRYVARNSSSPLYERLLWEKARIADQLVTNDDLDLNMPDSPSDSLSPPEHLSGAHPTQQTKISIHPNKKELVSFYKEILLNFPDGFYASYARNRIKELQDIES